MLSKQLVIRPMSASTIERTWSESGLVSGRGWGRGRKQGGGWGRARGEGVVAVWVRWSNPSCQYCAHNDCDLGGLA